MTAFSKLGSNNKQKQGPAKLTPKIRESSPRDTFAELPGPRKSFSSVISEEDASPGNTRQGAELVNTATLGATCRNIFWVQTLFSKTLNQTKLQQSQASTGPFRSSYQMAISE